MLHLQEGPFYFDLLHVDLINANTDGGRVLVRVIGRFYSSFFA